MKTFIVVLVTAVFAVLSYFLGSLAIREPVRQHFAESFPHVQGTVLTSQLTKTYGSKGRVYYHPNITYRYTVDGVELTGYRYRYDGHPGNYTASQAIVIGHPPGSAVDVYYNPIDKTDAVLSPGVDKEDMVTGLFMGVILIFLWLLPVKCAQQPGLPWTGPEETGGVRMISEMLVTRLRIPRYPPLSVAVVVAGALMLLATAVIAIGVLSTPLWETGEWALAIVLIGGTVVYAWQRVDVGSGKRDLVIDDGARTVQLPLTYGRRERTPVSISQIRSILLNKVKHRTKRGYYYTYMVTLDMAEGPHQKLIDLNMTRGDALATWLKEKLRLPERLTEPAEDEAL